MMGIVFVNVDRLDNYNGKANRSMDFLADDKTILSMINTALRQQHIVRWIIDEADFLLGNGQGVLFLEYIRP